MSCENKTPTSSRSPRLLIIATVLLALTGLFILFLPPNSPRPTAASPRPPATVSPTTASLPSGSNPAQDDTSGTSRSTKPSGAKASALPPHGEGIAGDRAIQQALEKAWPADLAPADEQQLRTKGQALLRADATGVGRADWPNVFGDLDQALAPAFATARFRVQAVIARRDSTAGRAVVHLVWAGADRGGTFTDGRVTDWYFTRTLSKKGAPTWNLQPPH
ncbi:hypothetical protein ABT040_19100 [Streptomyces sp. NPDC002688]|uniref:hypothetical protein n=1 Tax=Streptomyces sp. NPDC002688 TaxID=3154423 RepID=UPI00331931CB